MQAIFFMRVVLWGFASDDNEVARRCLVAK
jgi:hypothetical protein